MDDQNNTRPVTEAELHEIYDADSKREVQVKIERIFRETERLEDTEDEARAEGFGAGLFFAATMMMADDLNGLYPNLETEGDFQRGFATPESIEDVDVDADEIIRELEGVEADDAAMKRLERINREVLSRCGGIVTIDEEDKAQMGGSLYVAVPSDDVDADSFDTPDGWEAKDHGQALAGVVFARKGVEHEVTPETAEEAVEWIRERNYRGSAHVTEAGPATGSQPYTVENEIPNGWEYDTRTGYGEDEKNYLRKK